MRLLLGSIPVDGSSNKDIFGKPNIDIANANFRLVPNLTNMAMVIARNHNQLSLNFY